jgi:2-C-methyl-D-erythritol 4-phosphate cytidylyltransferase
MRRDLVNNSGFMNTLAILVAAGRGVRMGGTRPKAFLPVAGEPMLLRSARAFDAAGVVDGIVAVVPEDELEAAAEMLRPIAKLTAVVRGGERRQDSVLEGMKPAPDGFDGVVLVHDAARVFATPALIAAVAQAARRDGAAIPATPVTDTVKRVHEGRVVETVDRSALAAAQTPQGFRFAVLARAYEEAFRDGVTVTDEAMAVERIGLPVTTVAGEPGNRKLTTPEDMVWAEAVLAARGLAR